MKLILASMLLIASLMVNADDGYYEFGSVETEKIYEEYVDMDLNQHNLKDVDLKTINSNVKVIIGIGKEIWKIVEAGKPVGNAHETNVLHVLPKENNKHVDPIMLENWSLPKVVKYRTTFKNALGMKVIDFIYSVQFAYGGTYNGKGQYLTSISVIPNYIDVTWGFKLDVTSKVLNITNLATHADPVAAMGVELKYEAESILKVIKKRTSFTVTGRGEVLKN